MQKKIRDVERLIQKRGETPELLARLGELKEQKKQNEISMKEKKNADRYHMVKFFERKKLVRKILSLDHEIDNLTGKELKKAVKKRKALEQDLCYVLYFPNKMKYIALFANKEDSEDLTRSSGDEKTETLKQEALDLALKARQEDLDNGFIDKVAHAIDVGKNPKAGKAAKSKLIGEENSDSDSEGDETIKKRKIQDTTQPKLSKPIIDRDEVPSKKLKSDATKVLPPPIEAVEDEEEAGDSFFLEEAPEHDKLLPGASKPDTSLQHRISVGDIRKAVADRKSFSRIKDNGMLTKQELRLARWQEKVRNKTRVMGGVSFKK